MKTYIDDQSLVIDRRPQSIDREEQKPCRLGENVSMAILKYPCIEEFLYVIAATGTRPLILILITTITLRDIHARHGGLAERVQGLQHPDLQHGQSMSISSLPIATLLLVTSELLVLERR